MIDTKDDDQFIGYAVEVDFPCQEINGVIAKVDTRADSSFGTFAPMTGE
jgi:hypothetical protein